MRIAVRWVAAILVMLALADSAAAAGLDFAPTRKVFRVCNLLVPPSNANHNPYLFVALQRCALKPAGWEFENPLARRFVTGEMVTAWEDPAHAYVAAATDTTPPPPYDDPDLRMSSRAGYWVDHTGLAAGNPALLGRPIGKSWPQYWEVYLTPETAPRLKEFDLIYVSADALTLAGPVLRQGLLDAVRSGTTLWIDSGGVGGNFFGTTVDASWAPPRYVLTPALPPFTFAPSGGAGPFYRDPYPSAVADPLGDPNSELFVRPFALSMDPDYPLSSDEARLLGDAPAAAVPCDGYHLVLPAAGADDQQLNPILATRDAISGWAAPAIATCQYGDGHIIISAINIGQDVEEWYVRGAKGPDKYQTPDVKLAYNILAWGGAWETSRRSASGVAEARAAATPPLDIAWQYPPPPADAAEAAATKIGPVLAAPAVAHGRIYVVSLMSDPLGGAPTPARLFCFDARPERDLDGDGNSDDGLADYSLGLPYDLVWWRDLNDLAGPSGITDATPRWAGPTVADLPIPVARADGSLCTFAVLVAFVSQGGASNNGCVAAVDGDTGALLGVFPVLPFDALAPGANPAQVRDISTPVVRDGWVYFVCSEYDADLVPAPADRQSPGSPPDPEPPAANWLADGTYGRAWCINLQFLAVPSATALYYWCYPDPDLDRDGTPYPSDGDDTEQPNLLPPFAEPLWVAGVFPAAGGRPRQVPPDPGVVPVITTTTRRADDNYVEAVMHVSTAAGRMFDSTHPNSPLRIGRSFINFVFDPVGAWHCVSTPDPLDNEYQRRQGGWDLALVPTPASYAGGAWAYGLNQSYYRVTVSGGAVTSVESIVRQDSPSLSLGAGDVLATPGNTIILRPHRARYLLSATSATPPFNNPLRPPMGVKVVCNYNGGSQNEVQWLPGTVPWLAVNHDQERRVTPAAVRDNRLFATTTLPDTDAQNRTVDPGALSTARIVSQDLGSGFREWRFDPISEMPAALGFVSPEARTESAPAVSRDTVVATMALRPNAGGGLATCVLGLRSEPDLTVNLGSYMGLAPGVGIQPGSTVAVSLLAAGLPAVDPTQYTVGYGDATITFDPRQASRIRAGASLAPVGHIYGRPIVVAWTDSTGASHPGELYVVPPMTRFDYMLGFIKLRHYPVNAASVVVETAEGLPVSGWAPGEPTVSFGGVDLIPLGWIDLRGATYPTPAGPTPLVPGMLLQVHYVGFDNDWGFFGVGSPAVAPPPSPAPPTPPELHEVPYGFGPSASSVVLAGADIHLGTEGVPDPSGAFVTPAGAASENETLLSLLWDPVTGLVRGHLSEAARLGAFQTVPGQIAAATGSPAATARGLLIGSRVMSDASLGLQLGFLSALQSRETLVADGNRILRCTGQSVAGVLTGTESWEFGQDPATDDPVPMPLNHPSKVEALANGNLLIVDTGNNRVVEVDLSGRVVWPLDGNGCNYYSSASNTALRLLRPTDAERYESVEDPDGTGPAGVTQVLNTVIADSGNDRVVHVRTWWEWDPAGAEWLQRHRVTTVTTQYVRDTAEPTRRVKAHYTQVELIRRPDDGAVVGYLCAAPNLSRLIVRGRDAGGVLVTDPTPSTTMWNPNGTGTDYTWSLWSWLYTEDGTTYDPLQFAGLRGISVRRLGDVVYLDVACLQYQGRFRDWQAGTYWWSAFTGGGFTGQDPGAGVFEFRVNYSTPPGLIPSAYGPVVPVWIMAENPFRMNGAAPASSCYRYDYDPSDGSYALRPWFNITMPGTGGVLTKRFVPASVELLPTERRLIANCTGPVERLTKLALGQTGIVPTAEVFEVETDDGGDLDPANDRHFTDRRRIIPDPFGPDWTDPLISPVYADRVMH